MQNNSEHHFDTIASDYDYWKNHNRYYYQNLFKLYGSFIPKGSSVLEIGCGTGDIIVSLKPREGKGVDVSDQMIRIARKKHASASLVRFEREDVTASKEIFQYEYIFMADVLEHVDRLEEFLSGLSLRTEPTSTVVISVANPMWEWLLMLAERLKMKMPEGPHRRVSVQKTEELFRHSGFRIVERGYRLLVPKRIPGADWINERFYRNRVLARFGFVVYWILKK